MQSKVSNQCVVGILLRLIYKRENCCGVQVEECHVSFRDRAMSERESWSIVWELPNSWINFII